MQLEVIERALQLWSNPSNLIYSPFTGIGSEGVVALEMGRRFIGSELKESYYQQANSMSKYRKCICPTCGITTKWARVYPHKKASDWADWWCTFCGYRMMMYQGKKYE